MNDLLNAYLWCQFEKGGVPTGLSIVVLERTVENAIHKIAVTLKARGIEATVDPGAVREIHTMEVIDHRSQAGMIA